MISHLSHYGLLNIKGVGAKALLQGQLTCHLDEITEIYSGLGAHCNPQGRVISLFRVIQIAPENYLLQMPQTLIPIAQAALKKYAMFYRQVTLEDATQAFAQIGYQGAALPGHLLPAEINQVKSSEKLSIIKIGTDRFLILCPTDALESYSDLLQIPQASTPWECGFIAEKIPTVYPETSEHFLPHELNLPELQAVSFKKGCFTGQEIIARMQYRGKLKKHLHALRASLPKPAARGDDLYSNGKSCGTIVDLCQISYNEEIYELLVLLSDGTAIETLTLDPEQQYPIVPV